MSTLRKLVGEEGQDIVEYAVTLVMIILMVISTLRIVGSNANSAFHSVASALQSQKVD
jgi:Flp pilus assembly pilin Flp